MNMNDESVTARYGHVVGRFQSTRTPDIYYDVRLKGDVCSCNCPGFRFNGKCRHVEYAAAADLMGNADSTVGDPAVAALTRAAREAGVTLQMLPEQWRALAHACREHFRSGKVNVKLQETVVENRRVRLITLD